MQLINRFRTASFKYALLLVAAVYLTFSVGVIKASHFCMGREASVSYFSTEAEKCPCSLFADEDDNCCQDVQEIIKLDNDQKIIQAYTIRVPQLYILEDLYTERLITSLKTSAVPSTYVDGNVSPSPVPLFKAHCSFVFYDGLTA